MMKHRRPGRKWTLAALAVVAVIAAAAVYRYGFSHEGVVPSEEEYPVRGLDISSHNGDIDFGALRQQGFEFVLIKASEGSGFKDPRFYANISRARKAGLKVTAYHFFRFDATGYMQALNFLHSIRGQRLDLPAVIDVEKWTNPTNRTQADVTRTLGELIRRLEKDGVKVMLYTNKDGYEEYIRGRFDNYPVWICSFTRIDPSVKWVLWQYTHRGSVEGVNSRVDLNVFNGTKSEWDKWCAAHSALMQ